MSTFRTAKIVPLRRAYVIFREDGKGCRDYLAGAITGEEPPFARWVKKRDAFPWRAVRNATDVMKALQDLQREQPAAAPHFVYSVDRICIADPSRELAAAGFAAA